MSESVKCKRGSNENGVEEVKKTIVARDVILVQLRRLSRGKEKRKTERVR
jgi:hypothetical protein